MVEIWIVFVLFFVMIRVIAPYDSSYMGDKYIVLKSTKIRVLMIDKSRLWDETDRRKKDIDKITVVGIVLYIYAGISAILAVLSYFFVAKSQVDPWVIEHDFFDVRLDTLNECFSAGFLISFLLLYIIVLGVRMFQYAKTCDAKWFRMLLYIFSIIIIAICVVMPIMSICEAMVT